MFYSPRTCAGVTPCLITLQIRWCYSPGRNPVTAPHCARNQIQTPYGGTAGPGKLRSYHQAADVSDPGSCLSPRPAGHSSLRAFALTVLSSWCTVFPPLHVASSTHPSHLDLNTPIPREPSPGHLTCHRPSPTPAVFSIPCLSPIVGQYCLCFCLSSPTLSN